jgi:hypothetical protein
MKNLTKKIKRLIVPTLIFMSLMTLIMPAHFSTQTSRLDFSTKAYVLQSAPVLGGQIFTTGGNIKVLIGAPIDADFTHDIFLVRPGVEDFLIGSSRDTGQEIDLGKFDKGIELVFKIIVRNTGDIFISGPASRNTDNTVHTKITFISPTVAKVGFEDLFLGGDLDYNDVNFTVSGAISDKAQQKIKVPIDIKPTSCPNPINVGREGLLPVAILGTANFDVTDIDPASITLAGVQPLRSAIEDVATPFTGQLLTRLSCSTLGPDGRLDLTLKFDSEAVLKGLGLFTDGAVVKVPLSGVLKDGTEIEGEDIVFIVNKK